jgi:hypothetical protein
VHTVSSRTLALVGLGVFLLVERLAG